MIWEGNLDHIEKHNLAADRGDYTFWLGMNEYGDMVSVNGDTVSVDGDIVYANWDIISDGRDLVNTDYSFW